MLFLELQRRGGVMETIGSMPKRLDSALSVAVRKSLVLLERHHKTEEIRRGGGKSAPVPDKWTWRTGALAKSYRVYWNRGDLVGYYGSESKYSGILERGGDITPKRAKRLAIPLDAAKYGVGNATKSPRDFDGLFYIKSARGNELLVRRAKRGLEPMFVLKKKVTLAARPTIERTEQAMSSAIGELMADAALQVWRGER
jgi:hypothetical protein